jgi:hypothetical protein
MSHTPQDYLAIHTSLSEELRHSDGVVWQLAIAIGAVEEGVVALSDHAGFQNLVGKGALGAGFLLSVGLSFVLIRHTCDRRGVVRRIRVVEEELCREYPKIFAAIKGSPQWFASMLVAWFLFAESTVGFVLFVHRLLA